MPDPKDAVKEKGPAPRGMDRREEEAPPPAARAPIFTMKQIIIVLVIMVAWGGILLLVVNRMKGGADRGEGPDLARLVPLPEVAQRFPALNPGDPPTTIRIQPTVQIAGDLDEDALKKVQDALKNKEPILVDRIQEMMMGYKPGDFDNPENKSKFKARIKDIIDAELGGPGYVKEVFYNQKF